MRLALAALACAIVTSGCMTSLYPTPEEVAAFPGSGKSMIAIGVDARRAGCPSATVSLVREGGGEGASVFTLPGKPNVAMVQPGKYTPASIGCTTGNMIITLPSVDLWFLPVEVKAGDIVHLGTVTAETVAVQTDKSDAEEVGEAILTLGVSLFTGPGNNRHEFPMYDVRAATEGDREALRETIGDLASDLKSRKLLRIMSPKAVAAAYRNAYALHDDGTAPTEEEARGKFAVEIRKAIAISMDEFVKANAPRGAPKSDAKTPSAPPPVPAPAIN
jgi:hypothetical protein